MMGVFYVEIQTVHKVVTVSSRDDLPDDVMQACAVAVGVTLSMMMPTPLAPVAVRNDHNWLWGSSWDVCHGVQSRKACEIQN